MRSASDDDLRLDVAVRDAIAQFDGLGHTFRQRAIDPRTLDMTARAIASAGVVLGCVCGALLPVGVGPMQVLRITGCACILCTPCRGWQPEAVDPVTQAFLDGLSH